VSIAGAASHWETRHFRKKFESGCRKGKSEGLL